MYKIVNHSLGQGKFIYFVNSKQVDKLPIQELQGICERFLKVFGSEIRGNWNIILNTRKHRVNGGHFSMYKRSIMVRDRVVEEGKTDLRPLDLAHELGHLLEHVRGAKTHGELSEVYADAFTEQFLNVELNKDTMSWTDVNPKRRTPQRPYLPYEYLNLVKTHERIVPIVEKQIEYDFKAYIKPFVAKTNKEV